MDKFLDCLFCKIVFKKIESKIILENDYAISFMDKFPVSDGHILVIPKKHYENLTSCDPLYLSEVIRMTQKVSKLLVESELNPTNFNYLSNQGSISGQMIFHFHMHIIPKYEKNLGFEFNANNKNISDLENVYNKILMAKK